MSPVAQTIFEQLGGKRFAVMTGSKNWLYTKDSLAFKVGTGAKNKVKFVKVVLTPNDTYNMIFMKASGEIITTYNDIYCDMLQELFTEQTGFYTHF